MGGEGRRGITDAFYIFGLSNWWMMTLLMEKSWLGAGMGKGMEIKCVIFVYFWVGVVGQRCQRIIRVWRSEKSH